MRRMCLALMLLLLSSALVFAGDGAKGNEGNKKQEDDHNDKAPVQSGYAVISPISAPTGLVAFETFGLREGDSGTPQAGVLPPDLTTNSLLFIDSSVGLSKNLGVAIVNPNASTASVILTLRKNDGTQVATTTVNIPARQQTSKFFRDFFSGQSTIPQEMTGTLSITSAGSANLPVSTIGLRFRGSNFSTLPVTNLSGNAGSLPIFPNGSVGGAGAILLPQFVSGGGWATELILMNTNSAGGLTVRVDLFKPDGSPLSASLNGQTASSFTNLPPIPAGGVLTLAPRDQNGDDDF
jgi:hypothetical protein